MLSADGKKADNEVAIWLLIAVWVENATGVGVQNTQVYSVITTIRQ
jgi:hypothetical protein